MILWNRGLSVANISLEHAFAASRELKIRIAQPGSRVRSSQFAVPALAGLHDGGSGLGHTWHAAHASENQLGVRVAFFVQGIIRVVVGTALPAHELPAKSTSLDVAVAE